LSQIGKIRMMTVDDQIAAAELIESGTLVEFRILDVRIRPSPDEAEFGVEIDLQLGTEEDGDFSNDVEWGSFGFLFVLGVLSFADARPRGMSGAEFREKDEFGLADVLRCLTFARGELHFSADYLRGRRMKTNVVVRADGTITLTTLGRGKSALHWLDRLQGKKTMRLIDGGTGGT
jgi:hypothetical protein